MSKNKKLIIFGDSAFAEIAYEYFTHDSPYEVAAFAVSREYLKRDRLFDVPVVAFASLIRGSPRSAAVVHLVGGFVFALAIAFYALAVASASR